MQELPGRKGLFYRLAQCSCLCRSYQAERVCFTDWHSVHAYAGVTRQKGFVLPTGTVFMLMQELPGRKGLFYRLAQCSCLCRSYQAERVCFTDWHSVHAYAGVTRQKGFVLPTGTVFMLMQELPGRKGLFYARVLMAHKPGQAGKLPKAFKFMSYPDDRNNSQVASHLVIRCLNKITTRQLI